MALAQRRSHAIARSALALFGRSAPSSIFQLRNNALTRSMPPRNSVEAAAYSN
jgi:hypothetical protein